MKGHVEVLSANGTSSLVMGRLHYYAPSPVFNMLSIFIIIRVVSLHVNPLNPETKIILYRAGFSMLLLLLMTIQTLEQFRNYRHLFQVP